MTTNIEHIHTIDTLRQAIKKSRDTGQKTRLRAIIKLTQGLTQTDVAKEFVVDRGTIRYWIQQYNTGGIDALLFNKGGRPKGNPKWDDSLFESLTTEIDKGGYWSIPRMMDWLKDNHNVDIPEQTVWYRVNQLGYTYKSARPHPCQGDQKQQATFKKGA